MNLKMLNFILIVMVVVSAIAVVYVKNWNRMLYVELSDLQKTGDELNVEWGQLQIELSTLSKHGRIEELARKKLGMQALIYNEVVIVAQ